MQATQTFAPLFGSQETDWRETANVDADADDDADDDGDGNAAADDDDDAGANVVGEVERRRPTLSCFAMQKCQSYCYIYI